MFENELHIACCSCLVAHHCMQIRWDQHHRRRTTQQGAPQQKLLYVKRVSQL